MKSSRVRETIHQNEHRSATIGIGTNSYESYVSEPPVYETCFWKKKKKKETSFLTVLLHTPDDMNSYIFSRRRSNVLFLIVVELAAL